MKKDPIFVHKDGGIICPTCGKKFSDSYKANRHFFSIHSGIVYVCEICGGEHKRKDKLKYHLIKRHSVGKTKARAMTETAQIKLVKPAEVAKPLRKEDKSVKK